MNRRIFLSGCAAAVVAVAHDHIDALRRIARKRSAVAEARANASREPDLDMRQCLLEHAEILAGIPDAEWVEQSRRMEAMMSELGWTSA